MIINGLSQTGSLCDGSNSELQVRLDLNGTVNPLYFDVGATGSELNGLAIANAGENSYAFTTAASSAVIRCNFFGTYDGINTASSFPNSDGVIVDANNVVVGGDSSTDMNLSLAQTSSNNRFMFTSEATVISFKNNKVGVSLEGEYAVGGGAAAFAAASVARSIVNISNNHLYSDSDFYPTINMGGTVDTFIASNNVIGMKLDGSAAFTNATTAISPPGGGTDYDITDNYIAVTKSNTYGINMNGVADNVTIEGNKINVTADGLSGISGAGDGSAAIVNTAEVDNDDWTIEGNHIYGNRVGAITLRDIDGLLLRNNTVGMNAARTSCLPDSKDITIVSSQNVMIGGTGVLDGNAICAQTYYEALTNHTGEGGFSVLGNTLLTSTGTAFNVIGGDTSDDVDSPTTIAITENVDSTNITYTADLDAGTYRIEFFENDALLNSGNYPTAKTFVGVRSFPASGNPEQIFTETISGTGFDFLSATITRLDGSNDGFGNTSKVGGSNLESSLSVETTDGINDIAFDASSHEITQIITNTGPSTVTDIDFTMATQHCLDIISTSLTGTATDSGSFVDTDWNWGGVLEPNQTLEITFNTDVGCAIGDETTLNFVITSINYDSYPITNISDTIDYSDTNTIIGPQSDLQFVTSESSDPVVSYDTVSLAVNNHSMTQVITNNGPASIDQMTFYINSDCIDLTSPTAISVSGDATDNGVYDAGTLTWSGQLGSNQQLEITFTGPLSCEGGSQVTLNHSPTSITLDTIEVIDTSVDNNDYNENTDIVDASVDMSVKKNLLNPQDYATGATLQYEITLTNNGPLDMRINQLDGLTPGQSSLFIDVMPPDITFLSMTSDDDIGCDPYGPGSASLFGAAMSNHADHELVNCYVTSNDKVLANGDSISAILSVQVSNESTLQFRNYVYGAFGINDPNLAAMVGYDGSTDLIDHLESQGFNNNLAKSVPVIDVAVDKELVGIGSSRAGDTVTYNINFTNKGPMPIDLLEALNAPLFADIFPADALTYESVDQQGFTCQDLGPGSITFLGSAGVDHPNHQLLLCAYTGDSSNILNIGGSLNLTINFVVKAGAPDAYINYVAATTVPTDPDVYALNVEFGNAVGDVLDNIESENFDKVVYVTPADQVDTDDDGIADVTEDAGPNGGDANNDGTADSEQSNVSSFVSDVTERPVVLEVSEDCTITSTGVSNESANNTNDGNYVYPLGMMNFVLSCGDPGYTTDVTQYYYDQANQNYQLRKYYPTNNEYFSISGASISQQKIDNRDVVIATYQVQDGGALDVDGVENGSITDPAGLAVIDANAQQNGGVLSRTGDGVQLFIYSSFALVVASVTLMKLRRIRV